MAMIINTRPSTLGVAIAANKAMAIPIMPLVTPIRAVSCFDKPAKLAIKKRAATIYAIKIKPDDMFLFSLIFLEHLQHSACDIETTRNIDTGY